MDFHVLLDSPDQATNRLQIAALGEYDNPKYGEFSITRDDVADWQKNLSVLPGGRALIDLDHRADRTPRSTEAAGWITGIGWDGDTPVADVEWTPVGRNAIEEKRYLFFSPTYGSHKDERGNVYENTLIGGALTNRPFLSSMPAVTLASEERVSEARTQAIEDLQLLIALERPVAEPADSRDTMQAEALKLLDLPEDADEAKILEAVTALKAKADKPAEPAAPVEPEVKTLEQQAADAGKVMLDSAKFAEIMSNAQAGKAAADELRATKFENSFTRALEAGRAITAQKEQLERFYKLDADGTLKMLDEGPQIINVKPRGVSYQLDGSDLPEDQKLDKQVKDKLKELDLPMSQYPRILDQILMGADR